jgi:hypothetical protein
MRLNHATYRQVDQHSAHALTVIAYKLVGKLHVALLLTKLDTVGQALQYLRYEDQFSALIHGKAL